MDGLGLIELLHFGGYSRVGYGGAKVDQGYSTATTGYVYILLLLA